MTSGIVAIGVDLGGTKIAAGTVDERGEILARAELPSAIDDPSAVCAQISKLAERLGTEGVAGMGIGAAGIVNHATGHYLYGPNTGLRNFSLAEMASEAVGLPVQIDNDANCAAWAEHRFGVGRGCKNFLCVTLGTGIGGGLVVNGRPFRGAHGGAGEVGHMVVEPDGLECGCGRRGCWEQYASGLALERMAREEAERHPHSPLAGLPVPLKGAAISRLARDGDGMAKELFERLAAWLGLGLASLVNILEPERIAIAGGVVRDWELLEKVAVASMRERIEASHARPVPEVMPASGGPDAGIVGAALLVLDEGLR